MVPIILLKFIVLIMANELLAIKKFSSMVQTIIEVLTKSDTLLRKQLLNQ